MSALNSALAVAECRVDLVDVFIERAEARAYLWSIGDLDLHVAVDVLQADAERDGLVERTGQDGVQEIIAAAFRSFRGGRAMSNPASQDAAQSTYDAALWELRTY